MQVQDEREHEQISGPAWPVSGTCGHIDMRRRPGSSPEGGGGMSGLMEWSEPSWLFRDHPSFGMFVQSSGLSFLQDASKKFSSEMEASARETRMTTGRKI